MSKIDSNKLLISSDFYSVQGEGISSGVPSYFVRLGICNLTCGMSRQFANQLAKDQSLEDGDIFIGDLVLEGKATWTCDSTSQWLWRGIDQEFDYLIKSWKEEGIYEDIKNGTIHIIWTGGEPTIKGHQQSIVNFINYWNQQDQIIVNKYVEDVNRVLTNRSNYNEIETNGTIVIDEPLFKILDQINCSPKLSNSGMTEKQRINPEAIERIKQHSNYQFKFVISNEEDIEELFRDFIVPFSIPLKNVVCMPGLDSQTDFHERTQFVLEMAKKYKFRGLTRLHISAWDKTLNV
jgi:organic radical activating enzyme